MSILGIGSSPVPSTYTSPLIGGGAAGASSGDGSGPVTFTNAAQQFETYMSESPAQHMVDAWLKEHGLTRASLAKLPAAQQQSIMKEMAKDIADEMKRKATSKAATGGLTDVSA